MREYIKYIGRYYWLIFKIGIEHADRWDFMVAFILILIVIIAGLLGWRIDPSSILWFWAVIGAIVFDLIIIIPTRIGVRYIRSITPRLSAEYVTSPVPTGLPQSSDLFWRIRVKNKSRKPIGRCYAQIRSFSLVSEQKPHVLIDQVCQPWPTAGHELPWSRQSGGGFERDFGPDDEAYIDYAKTVDNVGLFTIPIHPNTSDNRPLYNFFRLPPGHYDITVSISSKSETMSPCIIRFAFKFNGHNAEVTESLNLANKFCIPKIIRLD